jgi:hypothetical protein
MPWCPIAAECGDSAPAPSSLRAVRRSTLPLFTCGFIDVCRIHGSHRRAAGPLNEIYSGRRMPSYRRVETTLLLGKPERSRAWKCSGLRIRVGRTATVATVSFPDLTLKPRQLRPARSNRKGQASALTLVGSAGANDFWCLWVSSQVLLKRQIANLSSSTVAKWAIPQ